MRIRNVVLGVSLFAGLLCGQQDMGVITGVVTDQSGANVPGAKIAVVNRDTNERWNTESGDTGAYTAGPLRIGVYNIEVEKEGFKKALWEGLQLHAQDRVRADFKLDIGGVAETIAVTAEMPLLQAETASLDKVVGEGEIKGLPLNGRNFQQLAWLTAGVTPATRSRDRESGFNSHGQPITQNNFIIDGVDNNNNTMGMQDRKLQVVVPSLDAVAEFKVQTSNYSAEFGRNSGSVMIVNLKSGTNQFHGTAYEYMRNDIFDARDMFNYMDRTGDGKADPEVLRQNQFGTTFGGPIRRNNTFFFGSWEGRRERHAQSDMGIVPTADELAGRFSPDLKIIKDPLTGKPFPGNAVPADRFDSTASKLLSLWPKPNFSGSGTRQNYIANPPWSVDRDQVDVRVDHNLTQSDKMFGRVSLSRYHNLRATIFDPPARGGQGSERSLQNNQARAAAFSYSHIFTPTLVNEFRYGFSRQLTNQRELSKESLSSLASKYGIRGIPENGQLFGLPQFEFTGGIGYQGLGEPGSMPNFKIAQLHQYLDNVSWNHGNHNFKFGADMRWNRTDGLGGSTSHGDFVFDGQFTGIGLADFLLGYPGSAQLTTTVVAQMRFRSYMFYAQDDWKVTPRLTLNLGLRYELNTPWIEKHNHMDALDITPGSNYGHVLTGGYCGDSYACRSLVDLDTNNWAPRVGLAWQVGPRTVLRSGAGVFYGGQGALGLNSRTVNNWPYNRRATAQSSGNKPAIKLSEGFPDNFLGSTSTPPANADWVVWQQNFPWPTIYQWNFALQHELVRDLSLTVAYVGSSSSYLMDGYNWNGSAPGPVSTEKQRRRMPQWNNINLFSPYGHSSYNGLDVQLERRYRAGLSFSGGYTWSHSLDNVAEQFGSGGGGLSDFRNFSLARANSNFDARHRFVGGVVYEIPLGKGRRWLSRGDVLDFLFGGWELSNLVSLQSGHPFTLTVSNARTKLGATGIANWWPDRLRSGRLDNPTPDRWFDTSAFVQPQSADGSWHIGNAGRGILTSDGTFNLDAGLMKSFRLTERVRLQFRWEVFNATNTPTLDDPTTNIDSPDFGKARGTASTPRQMQFAMRVSF